MPAAYPEDREAVARIGKHLRRVMQDRDWDQARLAAELTVAAPTVSRLLRGERGIGTGLTLRICRRLLIRPDVLLLTDP